MARNGTGRINLALRRTEIACQDNDRQDIKLLAFLATSNDVGKRIDLGDQEKLT